MNIVQRVLIICRGSVPECLLRVKNHTSGFQPKMRNKCFWPSEGILWAREAVYSCTLLPQPLEHSLVFSRASLMFRGKQVVSLHFHQYLNPQLSNPQIMRTHLKPQMVYTRKFNKLSWLQYLLLQLSMYMLYMWEWRSYHLTSTISILDHDPHDPHDGKCLNRIRCLLVILLAGNIFQ